MMAHAIWVVFHLADRAFAVVLADVDRVVPMAELAVPPGLPAILAGILNLAGEAVPVLRTDRLLGLREIESGVSTPIVVVRHLSRRLGLIVESVERLESVRREDVQSIPAGHAFADCAAGTGRIRGEPVVLLAVERMLLEEERRRIDDLRRRHEERLRELEAAAP
jgi:purine-binding chemotaxis protein CheW